MQRHPSGERVKQWLPAAEAAAVDLGTSERTALRERGFRRDEEAIAREGLGLRKLGFLKGIWSFREVEEERNWAAAIAERCSEK